MKSTLAPATVEQELSPPPYLQEPSSPARTPTESTNPDRKRRLSSDSPSPSANKRIFLTLDKLLSRVDRLEGIAAPCRYNSEEQDDIINHVNETVDEQLADVHVQILEMGENTEEMQQRLTHVGDEIRDEVAEVRDEVAGVEEEVAEMREKVDEVSGLRKRRARGAEIRDEVAKLRQEVIELRLEMRQEMEQTREEMRQEMRQEMEQLREEMRQERGQRQEEMRVVMELLKGLASGPCGGGGRRFNAASQPSESPQ